MAGDDFNPEKFEGKEGADGGEGNDASQDKSAANLSRADNSQTELNPKGSSDITK